MAAKHGQVRYPVSYTHLDVYKRQVLRDMPGQVANRLRGLVAEQVVAPAQAEWPWLGDSLRVL